MPAPTLEFVRPNRSSVVAWESRSEARRTILFFSRVPGALSSLTAELAKSYHVVEVSEQAACLRHAATLSPEAAIVDATDENGSREWLLPILRGLAKLATVPVMVLSSRHDGDWNAGLLREGAHDVLSSPWVPSELHARLVKLSERRRVDAELRERLRARDDALAQVAHDLRAPLNIISLCSEALADRAADGESSRVIRRATARMASLIDELLASARSKRGEKPTLQRSVASPASLIELAVAEHLQRARAAGVSLEAASAPDLPTIWVDTMHIERVLDNLIDNAIKFTGRGGAVVVRASNQHGLVEISVSDNGPGIPSVDLPRVFDAHWQKRRDGRGMGLGLAIAKASVEAHGGTLRVDSALGRGTTFSFSVPALL